MNRGRGKTLCLYGLGCDREARAGLWCHIHVLWAERTVPAEPVFDVDGEGGNANTGDALCICCNRRAPFRDGLFIYHESVVAKSRCAGVGRDALRGLARSMTGRVSSPRLQNIPIRTELGREIRRAFERECGFTAPDLSPLELRITASEKK